MKYTIFIGKCIHLKFYFSGVFAADIFSKLTEKRRFNIVNASPAQYAGSHGMVLLYHENKVYFADPLRFRYKTTKHFFAVW